MTAIVALWRRYEPFAWIVLVFSIVLIVCIAALATTDDNLIWYTVSYVLTLNIGVQLNRVFVAHRRAEGSRR